jgi:hypothetical protein
MNNFGFTLSDGITGLVVAFFWGVILGNALGLLRYMVWGSNEPAYKL